MRVNRASIEKLRTSSVMRVHVELARALVVKKSRRYLIGLLVGASFHATIKLPLALAQASYFPEFKGISYGDPTDLVRQKKGEPLIKDLNETKRQEIWRYSDIKVTFVNGKTNELEIIRRDPSMVGQPAKARSANRALGASLDQKRSPSGPNVKSLVPFKFEKGDVLQLLKEISLTESSESGGSPSQPQVASPMIPGFRPPEMGRLP